MWLGMTEICERLQQLPRMQQTMSDETTPRKTNRIGRRELLTAARLAVPAAAVLSGARKRTANSTRRQ
jgi:hypothetical protein